ncbi:hypothetical protein K402DRAFT_464743 [Aulographum hederae CBS 113979]|uniref:Uncharacterized protein n=1 Tax=Aulographum hederae CBS 113979 TaxID=1176131 RepID=A0A6G1GVW6_9PEZI|nr:hypothetical protein K402DRAFT_464743 [Aulographum hederae CBS 113979]
MPIYDYTPSNFEHNFYVNAACSFITLVKPDFAPSGCGVGFRQYFHHNEIGGLSITFSKAGGVDGNTRDGLHTPILQLANIADWEIIDVDGEASHRGESGNLCTMNPINDGKWLSWRCGIPTLGNSFYGAVNDPIPAPTYAPGTCGIHFIQYQRADANDPNSHYALTARIVDAAGTLVGEVGNSYAVGDNHIDASAQIDMASALPMKLLITVGTLDDQPIGFAYSDQSWDSGMSSQCNTGGYDSGSRQGDCTFAS